MENDCIMAYVLMCFPLHFHFKCYISFFYLKIIYFKEFLKNFKPYTGNVMIWLGRHKQWWLMHLRILVFSPSLT